MAICLFKIKIIFKKQIFSSAKYTLKYDVSFSLLMHMNDLPLLMFWKLSISKLEHLLLLRVHLEINFIFWNRCYNRWLYSDQYLITLYFCYQNSCIMQVIYIFYFQENNNPSLKCQILEKKHESL
jgi:hypothetical protein